MEEIEEAFILFKNDFIRKIDDIINKIDKIESESDFKEVFSFVHGIKGQAGFFGLKDVASEMHKLEDILKEIKFKDKSKIEDGLKILKFAKARITSLKEPEIKDFGEIIGIMKNFFQKYSSMLKVEGEIIFHIKDFPEKKEIFSDVLEILIHLIKNSIEHGRKRKIKVEVEIDFKDKLKIEVKDNGIGFPKNVLEKFKKGEIGISTKNSANEFSGRGVGLFACKKIAEKYKGKMEIKNTKNGSLTRIEMEIEK